MCHGGTSPPYLVVWQSDNLAGRECKRGCPDRPGTPFRHLSFTLRTEGCTQKSWAQLRSLIGLTDDAPMSARATAQLE
jgi:hypothetical protein